MTDSLTTKPALARTDGRSVQPASPTIEIGQHQVRRLGTVLTAGTLAWAVSIFTVGTVADTGAGVRFGDLTGFLFQLGLFALLTVQLRTFATGLSRKARGMIQVEYVLLGLASLWSLIHGLAPESVQTATAVVALDVFWPLSMLGMCIIGIKLALAGRWKGVLRFWPLVAESWAVVTVPVMGIFGEEVGRWVGGAHLLIGYATLGLLLALRPALTGATRE
jgi:hypothetical protein